MSPGTLVAGRERQIIDIYYQRGKVRLPSARDRGHPGGLPPALMGLIWSER